MHKGRFAPSPTGRMHLGNIYAALLSWLSVKSKGGQWILRIEDIDPQRSRTEWEQWILDDLSWLGLTWDEGPDIGGPASPYRQSERSLIYEAQLQKLQSQGLLYPCFCTRADILATQAPHESDGRVVYKGTCRPEELRIKSEELRIRSDELRIKSEELRIKNAPASLRCMATGSVTFTDLHYGQHTVDLPLHVGDFIVRRKDGAWAYQLAVVTDDALMHITEVVRGRDLLLSSPQQIYLSRLLGFTPPEFAHLPLLVNRSGQRLSKRDKALDLGELRQRHSPRDIIGRLACYAGLQPTPAPVSPHELLPLFSWSLVPHSDIVVD